MRLVLLTSSRADYGIYRPLLKRLKADPFFELKIVAFGTHLSKENGYTIQSIINDGYRVDFQIPTMPDGDGPREISKSMGSTITQFAELWSGLYGRADLIICLGDRYEMFSAVSASVPFQIPVAHLHGGETSEGAIDEIYRHSITLMSRYHFVSTLSHGERVAQIKGNPENIYNVGALGLDNIQDEALYSLEEFQQKYGVDLHKPTMLVTFHPETMNFERNSFYSEELGSVLENFEGQILVTMPNADTMNLAIRKKLMELPDKRKGVFLFESLGTKGYFSAMKYCAFLLGNTSSGIIEAASFGKNVINLGDRQKGRTCGENVIHCQINREMISAAIKKVIEMPPFSGKNIYGDGQTASRIISILKTLQ